jgi:CheY-like chemotaxis protein
MPDSNVSGNAVVLALPADLIFGARIRASAEQAGAAVVIAKNPDDLLTRLRAQPVQLVILDLDRRALGITDLITRIKAASPVTILAYASHVNESAIAEARAAGADKVIARGAFAKQLVELLRLYGAG